jgi:hypothetical protein
VDVVNGQPRRWRVENSWGEEENGRKGFYVMNDSWFDEYMFEIAARRSYLPAELAEGARSGADRAARVGPDGRAGAVTRQKAPVWPYLGLTNHQCERNLAR